MTRRSKKQFNIGRADYKHGERRIITVDNKQIGVFNVNGDYYALHNRCPHMAGSLCGGPVTGTTLESEPGTFTYGRKQELVRCGWHGWEFEIATGRCLVQPKIRAKTYNVTIQDGALILHI